MGLELPKLEKMPRQTLKRGHIVGSLKLSEVPSSIRDEMFKLWHARRLRRADVLSTGIAGAMARYSQDGLAAIPAGIVIGILFARANSMVRKQTIEVARDANRFRNNVQFKEFIKKGATHVLMTENGTLKFVKAPEHEGKAFQPIIGRLRAPLTAGKK